MFKSRYKFFVKLCSLSVFASPISFVLSCSNNSNYHAGDLNKLISDNGINTTDQTFIADQDIDKNKDVIAGWSAPFSLIALWNQVRLLNMENIPWHNGVLYSSMANALSITRSFATNLGWDYNDITKETWGNDIVFLNDDLVENQAKTDSVKFDELCIKSSGVNKTDLAPLFNIAKSIKSDTTKISNVDIPKLWKDNFFFGAGYNTTKAHGSENILQNNFDVVGDARWVQTSASFQQTDPSQHPEFISQMPDSMRTTLYSLIKNGVPIDSKFNDKSYQNKFSVINSVTWIDGQNPGTTVEDIELAIENSDQKIHRIIKHNGAAPIYPIIDSTIWGHYEASIRDAILKIVNLYRDSFTKIGTNSSDESSTSLTWNSLLSYLVDDNNYIIKDPNNPSKYIWSNDQNKISKIDSALSALNNGSHNVLGVKIAYQGVDDTLFDSTKGLDFFNASNNLQVTNNKVAGLNDPNISILKIDNNWRNLSKAFLPLRRVNFDNDFAFVKDEKVYDSHLSIPYLVGKSQREIAEIYKLDPSVFE